MPASVQPIRKYHTAAQPRRDCRGPIAHRPSAAVMEPVPLIIPVTVPTACDNNCKIDITVTLLYAVTVYALTGLSVASDARVLSQIHRHHGSDDAVGPPHEDARDPQQSQQTGRGQVHGVLLDHPERGDEEEHEGHDDASAASPRAVAQRPEDCAS